MGMRKYYWKIRDFLEDKKRKPISVIASRNGQLFELHDLLFGRFVFPVQEIRELDEIKSGFELKIPKIPGYILEKIISFFRIYCERYDAEVLVHIYLDTHTNKYVMDCPYQYVSKHGVNVDNDSLDTKRYKKIMDIHSHNSMDAYFSSTDNADEVHPLLYGVIGTLDKEPTMVFRVGVNGYFLEIPSSHLFSEFNVNNHIPYPLEWEQRVVVKERAKRERIKHTETRI